MSPLNIFQISVGLDRGMWVIAGVTERYQVQSCGWSLAEQWIILIAPWFFFYFFRVSEIQTSWADLAKVVFLFRLINGWWKKKERNKHGWNSGRRFSSINVIVGRFLFASDSGCTFVVCLLAIVTSTLIWVGGEAAGAQGTTIHWKCARFNWHISQ